MDSLGDLIAALERDLQKLTGEDEAAKRQMDGLREKRTQLGAEMGKVRTALDVVKGKVAEVGPTASSNGAHLSALSAEDVAVAYVERARTARTPDIVKALQAAGKVSEGDSGYNEAVAILEASTRLITLGRGWWKVKVKQEDDESASVEVQSETAQKENA